MTATEKSCKSPNDDPKSQFDIVKVDTPSDQTPDFIMQMHDAHQKIRTP